MPFIITKQSINMVSAQAVYCLWNHGQTDSFMSPVKQKWSVQRAAKKMNAGKAFAKTGAFHFMQKYIIHCNKSAFENARNAEESLSELYLRCLEYAHMHHFESVAIPLWASAFGELSPAQVYDIVGGVIQRFLQKNEICVYLRVPGDNTVTLEWSVVEEMRQKAQKNRVVLPACHAAITPAPATTQPKEPEKPEESEENAEVSYSIPDTPPRYLVFDRDYSRIAEMIKQSNRDTFSELLLHLIAAKGVTPAHCYKKANIERSLFSKIKSNPYYQPGKTTVVAFALALELNMEETELLLKKAGFTFSDSIVFDMIIRYCIENEIYDIFKVNDILFSFGQPILGSK